MDFREKTKYLNYWTAVEFKFRNKKRTPSQDNHYKHAVRTIKDLKK